MAKKANTVMQRLRSGWGRLREALGRRSPRRVFAGKFLAGSTKIIQTASAAPNRRHKVKRRARVVMARRKRMARSVVALLKLLLFCGALGAFVWGGVDYMYSSPKFAVAHIGVEGNTHVRANTIIRVSGIIEGRNIFRLNLARSAKAIEKVPRVLSARVKRKLPDEIHIEITERQPLALVLSEGLFYLDDEARVCAEYDPSQRVTAPIITGAALAGLRLGNTVEAEGIEAALEIVKTANKMRVPDGIRLSEINIDDPDNLVMVAERSGARIIFGSGDLEGKLWRLAKVAEEIERSQPLQLAELERVDMRFEAIVPAKFRN